MFTGIVQHVGVVQSTQKSSAGRVLAVDLGPLTQGLNLGDSVAINGACLTASKIEGAVAHFNAITETLSRTTLGSLARGSRVNLERALRLGQGLDGHIVQGHVDGLATLKRISTGQEYVLEFSAGPELTDQMVPKGSVAVSGVSLTLVKAQPGLFSVAIIPTTLRDTTLGDLSVGDPVNIETDVIGKYVMKYLRGLGAAPAAGLTLDKLREEGYL